MPCALNAAAASVKPTVAVAGVRPEYSAGLIANVTSPPNHGRPTGSLAALANVTVALTTSALLSVSCVLDEIACVPEGVLTAPRSVQLPLTRRGLPLASSFNVLRLSVTGAADASAEMPSPGIRFG